MKRRFAVWMITVVALLAAGSCATSGDRKTGEPPIVRVGVLNFTSSTDIGITTEIHFSVSNLTDRELRDLTLTVDMNPSDGVDVPFSETTIDRIAPNGSWSPNAPFLVRGRRPGTTAIFFIVSRDGKVLAKDYALVDVASGQFYRVP